MKYQPNISKTREDKIFETSFAPELSEEGFRVVKPDVNELLHCQNLCILQKQKIAKNRAPNTEADFIKQVSCFFKLELPCEKSG